MVLPTVLDFFFEEMMMVPRSLAPHGVTRAIATHQLMVSRNLALNHEA
jgi:hypothetical protein